MAKHKLSHLIHYQNIDFDKYLCNRHPTEIPFFPDYPDFKPNLTPEDIFRLGSFGGTYWRPIKSIFFPKKFLIDQHLKYSWFDGLPDSWLTTPYNKYDSDINYYGVKCGSTLEEWEKKDWIKESHPYGWVQWYCDFYNGERCDDDERQIRRWENITGENGRFKKRLINLVRSKNTTYNDFSVSPTIRQTLQHWGYRLTEKDVL